MQTSSDPEVQEYGQFDSLLRLARYSLGATAVLLADAHGCLLGVDGVAHEVAQSFATPLCLDAAAPPLRSRKGDLHLLGSVILRAADGTALGWLCALDKQPRTLDAVARRALDDAACIARELLDRPEERRLALAIAGSGTGVWDRHIPSGQIHYSSGWKALLGYADDEISNRIDDAYARVHPDDLDYVQATIRAHFEGRTPAYEVEHRLRHKEGHYLWVCSRGKVTERDDAGRPLRMIGTTTDITERKRIEAELQVLATTDFLTQLPNRRHFMQRIEAELGRVQRSQLHGSAILMCDLDHFKEVNDRWGHGVGDEALRHFASILRRSIRRIDFAGRMGGEEFAVVLGDTDIGSAVTFARRLQQQLADQPLLLGCERIPLSISVGIAPLQADDGSVEAALSRSDDALYRAKQNGRNRIECHGAATRETERAARRARDLP